MKLGQDPREWFSDDGDVRTDENFRAIHDLLKAHDVHNVSMIDRIMGCPHEEVIDYPAGEKCPRCPFWANRDRYTGAIEQL